MGGACPCPPPWGHGVFLLIEVPTNAVCLKIAFPAGGSTRQEQTAVAALLVLLCLLQLTL